MHHLFALFLHWVVSALALLVTAAIVPGFRIKGFAAAMGAALLIGAADYFVWPVLFVLTLPITVITLGLFLFVLNAIILRLCAALMSQFSISGWFSAIIGSIILSFCSWGLHSFLI